MPTRSERRRINIQQGKPVNEGLEPTVTELKPCPFCGSKAKHFVFCEGEYDETKLRHNIQCLNEKHNCFASVGRDWVLGYNTEKEAIEAWKGGLTMAKIFKVSAYIVDPVDEFNKSSLEDCLVYWTQNDISLKHIKVDSVNIGEWDDDLPVNKIDCPITEFEKYFKENTNV